MKRFTFTIEELNAIFLALIGAEQRATGRAAGMYGALQPKIKDLAKEAMNVPDFELILEVQNV